MKRILRGALSVVFVVGVTIAFWPLGQHAYGVWSQRALQSQWQRDKTKPQQRKTKDNRQLKQPANQKIAVQSPALKSRASSAQVSSQEWPSTRIAIPDIQLEAVVVQGLDEKALARGPGHDPRSALPGEAGNCVIAGHRNVYGSWFYRVDALWAGSLIRLETPDATYNYEVISVQSVAESDYTVLRPPTDPKTVRLTLITCTLPHTPNRIIVIAEKMPDEVL